MKEGSTPLKAIKKSSKKTSRSKDWVGLHRFDQYRGDGGHDSLWHQLGGRDPTSKRGIPASVFDAVDVPRWHFEYYDRDKSGDMSYKEFIPFARERFLVYQRTKADLYEGPDPPGHLQPLGSHRPATEPMDILEKPIHPKEFWSKYIRGHRPCLFRGVDKDSTGFKKWTPEYIAENFGNVDLKIEPKKESRGDSSVLNFLPKRLSVKEFMKRRIKDNVYAVTIIPQSMAWDVNVPSSVLCGSREKTFDKWSRKSVKHPFPHPAGKNWLTHIYEANLWLADGRTRSQLHYDKESNMNCLYKGEKKWILIDTRKHFDNMAWVRGGRYRSSDDLQNSGTDWVPIDPDAVDMRVHKKFSEVTYYEVTQKAGDCIFLPYAMVHWVNKTSPGFQVAVSYMWLPNEEYDAEACEVAPVHANVPLAAFDILWFFSGRGVIPQGYPDPDYEMLRDIKRIMSETRQEYFTLPVLQTWLNHGDSPLRSNLAEQKVFMKRLSSYAKDPAKGLRISEMRWPQVPLDEWLKLATEGDPEGMLPCDIGHKYDPRPPEEWVKMNSVLDNLQAEHISTPKLARTQEL